MSMNRRNFLGIGAATGAMLAAAPFVRWAHASTPYQGPFYVQLHAAGGWDPTYFCDPKTDPAIVHYTAIGTTGAFRYARTPIDDLSTLGMDPLVPAASAYLLSNEAFFTKYRDRVRIVNGVDTTTNNHDIGTRAAACGHGPDGYPSFGALAAAIQGRDKALAYISSGGYDATQGLVPTTRLSSAAYARVANPFEGDVARPGTAKYHTDKTQARIRAAHAVRTEALATRAQLPREKQALEALERARAQDMTLSQLQLPTPVVLPGLQLGDLQNVLQQIQLVLAAFKSGLAVSASIGLGGFDTHANHDAVQVRQLAKLLRAIDFIWETAATEGVASNMTLMVTGDFGRGPTFNATAGKDHWPVTSAMLMGRGIAAGVVGSTDDASRPLAVDPTTLRPSTTGIRITPTHVHQELRRIAGFTDNADAKRFPLKTPELRILG